MPDSHQLLSSTTTRRSLGVSTSLESSVGRTAGLFLAISVAGSLVFSGAPAQNSLMEESSLQPAVAPYSSSVQGRSQGASLPHSVDLQRERNAQLIRSMASYQDDWDGYGAQAFSYNAIAVFEAVIDNLDYQPSVMPTARGSALMEYDFPDGTQLAFEVQADSIEMVRVPQGNFDKATDKVFTDNFIEQMNEAVRNAYESQPHR